jgi:uncharacterized protein YigE (DUF2233 family)
MKFPHVLFFMLAIPAAATTRVAEALETQAVRFADGDYRVVDVDLSRDMLELHWKAADGVPLASIERMREWGREQGRSLVFATNAGIYDSEYRPLGLHIEDGSALRRLNTSRGAARAGNFAIQPNGVFYVDKNGQAGVVQTAAWNESGIHSRLATQSGPMLVVDGAINANFQPGSDSLKWRSGVCAPTPGHVVFAVSAAPVNFHAFARLFRDQLGCRDALYLDGTLSRLWTQADGYAGAPAMMVRPYAGIFAVFGALPP